MKLATFFKKFDQFAGTPGAVAKMRELILESAIRGKLVPHHAGDEPASELLKRMASAQVGQARKQPALPPVGNDAYFQIPLGWAWTRLGDTGRIYNGDSVSQSGKAELARVEDGLPYIATKDVGYGRAALVYDNGLKVPRLDPRFKVARANAVLICAEGGSAGRKVGITDRDICFGNKLYANEVWEGVHHRYIFYVYQAPTFFREFAARMTGIIGGISRSAFLSLPIPLPPEGEQKRIVAKVDELVGLCDRLEAQQQERETRHAALARASLARFAGAPTPANLDFVFHKSYDIPPADLRKSILTLAVQGKLVPQEPYDEPAKDLLQRVDAEREKLIQSKKIRRQNFLGPVADDAIPFDIPSSWQWRHLADVCFLITDGAHRTPQYLESGVPFLSVKDVSSGEIDFSRTRYISEEAHRELCRRCPPELGDILLTKVGTTGIAVTVDEDREFSIFVSLALLKFSQSDIDGRYLKHLINSPFVRQQSADNTQGIGNKNLVLRLIGRFTVPIPPLAEQRRIVAKVEKLMALVDALGTQLASSRATGTDLMEAVVAELTGRADRC